MIIRGNPGGWYDLGLYRNEPVRAYCPNCPRFQVPPVLVMDGTVNVVRRCRLSTGLVCEQPLCTFVFPKYLPFQIRHQQFHFPWKLLVSIVSAVHRSLPISWTRLGAAHVQPRFPSILIYTSLADFQWPSYHKFTELGDNIASVVLRDLAIFPQFVCE